MNLPFLIVAGLVLISIADFFGPQIIVGFFHTGGTGAARFLMAAVRGALVTGIVWLAWSGTISWPFAFIFGGIIALFAFVAMLPANAHLPDHIPANGEEEK